MVKYNVYSDIDQTLQNNFVTDLHAINQSIYNLLTTPKGARTFLAAYGTNIQSILFEPDDLLARDLLYKEIIDAISFWEGRRLRLNVGATTVKLNPDKHEFIVNLIYNVVGLDNATFEYTLGISP